MFSFLLKNKQILQLFSSFTYSYLEALILFGEPAKSNGQRGNLIWMTMDLNWIYLSLNGFSIEYLTVDFRLPWIFIWIPGHKLLIENLVIEKVDLLFESHLGGGLLLRLLLVNHVVLKKYCKKSVRSKKVMLFRRYLWFSTLSFVLGFGEWNHPDLQQNLSHHVEYLSSSYGLSLSLLLSLSLSLSTHIHLQQNLSSDVEHHLLCLFILLHGVPKVVLM